MAAVSVVDFGQIPMSPVLAQTLARASDAAAAMGYAEVTLEHLLLALTGDPDAVAVLDSSHVDIARVQAEAGDYLSRMRPPGQSPEGSLSVSPVVRRILEAAAAAARGGRRRDINGAIVLAAIVGDGRSVASQMLQAQGLTFDEAIRALQNALMQPTRDMGRDAGGQPPAADDVLARARERVQSRSAPGLRDIMQDQPRPATPPPAPVFAPLPEPQPIAVAPMPAPQAVAAAPAPVASGPAPAAAPVANAAPAWPADFKPAAESQPDLAPGPETNPVARAEAVPELKPASESKPVEASPDSPSPSPPLQTAAAPAPVATQSMPISVPMPQGQPSAAPPQWQPAAAPPPSFNVPPGPIDFSQRKGPTPPPIPPSGGRAAFGAHGPPPSAPPSSSPSMTPKGGAPALNATLSAPSIGLPGFERAPGYPSPASMPMPGTQARPQAQAPRRRDEPAKAETGQLAENVPRSMRVGNSERIEIRIAKAHAKAITSGLEGGGLAWRHDVTVSQAMSVRLRAPDGGFFIETASPETQWIENQLGLMAGEEYASWRFLVTPNKRGWARLQIIVSARTIGADGLAAETALPDQVIEVKVRTNLVRAFRRWSGWILAAVAGGALAKFGEGALGMALPLVQEIMKKYGG